MHTDLFMSAINEISKDDRLLPTHISLYVVLLSLWHKKKFRNPINISRKIILQSCKIKSQVTYHKCIKELNDFGYIKYAPSYNPFTGSMITMLKFNEVKVENKLTTNKEILIRITIES